MSQKLVPCPMGHRCQGNVKHYVNSQAYHDCLHRNSSVSGWGTSAGTAGGVMGDLSGGRKPDFHSYAGDINKDKSYATLRAERELSENQLVNTMKPSFLQRMTGRRGKKNEELDGMVINTRNEKVMRLYADDQRASQGMVVSVVPVLVRGEVRLVMIRGSVSC